MRRSWQPADFGYNSARTSVKRLVGILTPRSGCIPMTPANTPSAHERECPDCGLFQHIPPLPANGEANCLRCDATLRRTRPNSFNRALALTLTAFVLYFVAVLAPFLSVDIVGQQRETTMLSLPAAFWQGGRLGTGGHRHVHGHHRAVDQDRGDVGGPAGAAHRQSTAFPTASVQMVSPGRPLGDGRGVPCSACSSPSRGWARSRRWMWASPCMALPR